jgi:hypothetical protein
MNEIGQFICTQSKITTNFCHYLPLAFLAIVSLDDDPILLEIDWPCWNTNIKFKLNNIVKQLTLSPCDELATLFHFDCHQ